MDRSVIIPHLEENVQEAIVVGILVSVGDFIEKDQNILELEINKASIEIPSGIEGVVKEIRISEGDTVKVGEVVFTIDAKQTEKEQVQEKEENSYLTKERKSHLPKSMLPPAEDKKSSVSQSTVKTPEPEIATLQKTLLVPASPSTRRFAREIGVDISLIPGSGPGGRISIEDVKVYSKQQHQHNIDSPSLPPAKALPNFAKWGTIHEEPVDSVRAAIAENVSYAWSIIPHVTQLGEANITDLERQRKNLLKAVPETKLTITVILLKVISAALKKFPRFNASIDMKKRTIIYKSFCNIGVAVDTEHGLLVPVIHDVDKKGLYALSEELRIIAQKAREKRLRLEEIQGGTFTISNLGGIGGAAFTPIINWPQVAILGIGRGKQEKISGEDTLCLTLPLALSYDHRIIDGADGARFLQWIIQHLENPLLTALDT